MYVGARYDLCMRLFHERGAERADAQTIIGAALEVHRELGPGLLEHPYEVCLSFELASRGLSIERQKPLPVVYKNQRLDCGYRLDLVVEGLRDH